MTTPLDEPWHPFDEIFEETLKRVRERHDAEARLLRFGSNTIGGTLDLVAMIEYCIPVKNPKLKQQALVGQVRFLGDRAELFIIDFPRGSFLYADPAFPGNMYRQI